MAPRSCSVEPGAPGARARAMRWTITSVSVEVWKIEPWFSSSTRSCSALTRLPLWATATAPPAYCTAIGCAFLRWEAPVGRVADVADGRVALQRREHVGVEDVRDEPHLAVDVERLAVGRDDAGRLLAAVLQRVQAEVGVVRRLLGVALGPDPEDPALLLLLVEDGVVPHEAAEYNGPRLKYLPARPALRALLARGRDPRRRSLGVASLPWHAGRAPGAAARRRRPRGGRARSRPGAAEAAFDAAAGRPHRAASRGSRTRARDGPSRSAPARSSSRRRAARSRSSRPRSCSSRRRSRPRSRARVADLGLDGLVLAATHTHAGPGGYWRPRRSASGSRPGPYDPRSATAIAAAVADAIRRAAAALAPARVSVARGVGRRPRAEPLRRRSRTRRSPSLRLERPDGAPVAEVTVFAAHATILGKRNRDHLGRLAGAVPRGRRATACGSSSRARSATRAPRARDERRRALRARRSRRGSTRSPSGAPTRRRRSRSPPSRSALPAVDPGGAPALLRRAARNLAGAGASRRRRASRRCGSARRSSSRCRRSRSPRSARGWRAAPPGGAADRLARGRVPRLRRGAGADGGAAAGETGLTYYGPALAATLGAAVRAAADGGGARGRSAASAPR